MTEAQAARTRAPGEKLPARGGAESRLHVAAARAVLQQPAQRTRWVARRTPPARPLSRTERAILDHLGRGADEQRLASASLAQLARATGVTPQGANYALHRLLGRGRLRLVTAGRPGTPARYQVLA